MFLYLSILHGTTVSAGYSNPLDDSAPNWTTVTISLSYLVFFSTIGGARTNGCSVISLAFGTAFFFSFFSCALRISSACSGKREGSQTDEIL